MKSTIWKILGLLLILGLIIYIGASWFFSSQLIARETATLAEASANRDGPDVYGLPQPEEVIINNGDVNLSGWYFENELDGDCGVMMLHGYTGTRLGALQYSPLFWERGCDILAYDARAHGDSDGEYHTYGFYEKEDGQAALDWFAERTMLDPAQIGLVGISYGAATVLQMIPEAQDVAFVLSDSPYADLRTITTHQAEEQFGSIVKPFVPTAFLIAELRADFDADDVSPQTAVDDAAMPIFITHSLQDEFTPSTNSEAIYANSNPATTVLQITDWGASHGRSILVDYDTFAQQIDEFLTEFVPEFGLNNDA